MVKHQQMNLFRISLLALATAMISTPGHAKTLYYFKRAFHCTPNFEGFKGKTQIFTPKADASAKISIPLEIARRLPGKGATINSNVGSGENWNEACKLQTTDKADIENCETSSYSQDYYSKDQERLISLKTFGTVSFNDLYSSDDGRKAPWVVRIETTYWKRLKVVKYAPKTSKTKKAKAIISYENAYVGSIKSTFNFTGNPGEIPEINVKTPYTNDLPFFKLKCSAGRMLVVAENEAQPGAVEIAEEDTEETQVAHTEPTAVVTPPETPALPPVAAAAQADAPVVAPETVAAAPSDSQ